jgi:hypothetical protein
MTNYYTPIVVQQTIPNADMTPLERLLLTQIFEAEPEGDALYLFAETEPSDLFDVPVEELRAAVAASMGVSSTAADYVQERLRRIADGDTHVEIDFSGTSWEFILQDIIRRSITLDFVTVVAAFTCSKMRPDGFGGMAALITADAVKGKSTNDILQDFLAEREIDAPTSRSHVLLHLDEAAVRAQIGEVIATDATLASLTSDAVTDGEIHTACCAVAEHTDLSQEKGAAVFRAALAAISAAERRRARDGSGEHASDMTKSDSDPP